MKGIRLWLVCLSAIFLLFIATEQPVNAATSKAYHVTANLFVPGHLNKQLPGVNAYLTNGNNPLGIGGYQAIAPTQPVANNATLHILANGKKQVVIDVLNPVFTLQQIEDGNNVKIIDIVKDNAIYEVGSNRIEGRITQITVELLDDSGTYTFTNCIEYPTLLGSYWYVPLSLAVDFSSMAETTTGPTNTFEVVAPEETVVETVKAEDGSQVVTMTTANGSISTTTSTASSTKIAVTVQQADLQQLIAMPTLAANSLEKAAAIQFLALGDKDKALVRIPIKNPTLSTVVVAVDAQGNKEIIKTSHDESSISFDAKLNTTYKVIQNGKLFTDVTPTDWYKDVVQYMTAHEWINGSNNRFNPNQSISRSMVVTILHRMAGRPVATITVPFNDVVRDAYYVDAVKWAYENGIVKGYNAQQFGVNDNITREQFVVILWRYGGSPASTQMQHSFKDFTTVSPSAKEAMSWAIENGILSGKANGTIDPHGFATRAQGAKMLMAFAQMN